MIWLDPMPLKEDLSKAYTHYYTHQSQAGRMRTGTLQRFNSFMERGYWAGKFNYPIAGSAFAKAIGKLLYFFPLRRRAVDGGVGFLHAVPDGRLLEVGCGAGDWLMFMRGLGWQVEGVDFDERAVEVGMRKGLNIRCGTLEDQFFPSGSFNAVFLSHVIEHLPDPIGTVAECGRVLQNGGKLVMFTPNSLSLGHKLFGANWRGLEPPRHLHLFSMQSMRRILERAGFRDITIRPHIAKSIVRESMLLYLGQTNFATLSAPRWFSEIFARLFVNVEFLMSARDPSVSDCLAAIAVK